MINHQEPREKYKPKIIKVLFVAEAPPERSQNVFFR
jgi:hypothetical protein